MRPERARVLRKERHKAWRGFPRGRRATHQVETTYGRKQRERDRLTLFAACMAAATDD